MLHFIGGKSQVGKSEISKEIKKLKPQLIIIETDKCRVWKPGHDPDELGWPRIIEYIKALNSTDDVLVEGVAVTPERVKELEGVYPLRAVFIGFGNETYVDVWIQYAKKNPLSYLAQEEVRRKAAGEPSQFATFSEEVKNSEAIRERAENLGYKYFGMTNSPSFEERIKPIINYIIKGN